MGVIRFMVTVLIVLVLIFLSIGHKDGKFEKSSDTGAVQTMYLLVVIGIVLIIIVKTRRENEVNKRKGNLQKKL